MKRLIVVVVAIFVAVTLLLLVSGRGPDGRREGDAGASAVPVGASAGAPVGDAAAVAASSVASRQPKPTLETIFRPALFSALPDGLDGRSLKQHYDDLAARVERGDATAAVRLGHLVRECDLMLYGLRRGRRGGSPNPLVQKYIVEKEKVAGEQCPALGDEALASAGAWYLRAAEMGNREALKRLQFHPPKTVGDDADARKTHWRKIVTEGLAQLGRDGDVEAMVDLGHFYFDEGEPASLRQARHWFDLASRAGGPAYRVEGATKMRDIVDRRLSETGANGR